MARSTAKLGGQRCTCRRALWRGAVRADGWLHTSRTSLVHCGTCTYTDPNSLRAIRAIRELSSTLYLSVRASVSLPLLRCLSVRAPVSLPLLHCLSVHVLLLLCLWHCICPCFCLSVSLSVLSCFSFKPSSKSGTCRCVAEYSADSHCKALAGITPSAPVWTNSALQTGTHTRLALAEIFIDS